MQKLLTKELIRQLPSTEEARSKEDPICLVKLFNPYGIGRWWIAGYDPENQLCYGVAELFEREIGDFSFEELKELKCPPFGLPIERDLYFCPVPISKVLKEGVLA